MGKEKRRAFSDEKKADLQDGRAQSCGNSELEKAQARIAAIKVKLAGKMSSSPVFPRSISCKAKALDGLNGRWVSV